MELSTGCPTAGCQGRGEPARVASQEAIRPLGSPEFKLALLGIAFVAVGAGVLLTALWFLLDALLDF